MSAQIEIAEADYVRLLIEREKERDEEQEERLTELESKETRLAKRLEEIDEELKRKRSMTTG